MCCGFEWVSSYDYFATKTIGGDVNDLVLNFFTYFSSTKEQSVKLY